MTRSWNTRARDKALVNDNHARRLSAREVEAFQAEIAEICASRSGGRANRSAPIDEFRRRIEIGELALPTNDPEVIRARMERAFERGRLEGRKEMLAEIIGATEKRAAHR